MGERSFASIYLSYSMSADNLCDVYSVFSMGCELGYKYSLQNKYLGNIYIDYFSLMTETGNLKQKSQPK
jgi:hypothetical protein